MIAIALTGLSLSIYLAWSGLTGSPVVGCDGGTFDCNHVLTSRWSKVAGIPVGIPASGMYAALLVCLVCKNPIATKRDEFSAEIQETKANAVDHFVAFASIAAALAAIWFIGLQFVAVGSICMYCMAAHACGLTLAGLVLWHSRLMTKQRLRVSAAAAVAVMGLIITQWQGEPPRTFVVEPHKSVPQTIPAGGDVDSLFAAPGDGEEADSVFDAPDLFEAPESEPHSDSETIFAAPE